MALSAVKGHQQLLTAKKANFVIDTGTLACSTELHNRVCVRHSQTATNHTAIIARLKVPAEQKKRETLQIEH